MPLEVSIEKRFRGFHLSVAFSVSQTPLGLLGPSGAGKSLTLRAIAGLETPERGRIVLHDRVLFDSERGINVPARDRHIGLLFQQYALFPHLTAAQNIAFGLRRLPASEQAARVQRQISAVHLEGLEHRYPATLSGGEQQRVALARALATEPAALLLDEPFSALDTHLRESLERQLRETFRTYRGATVFVSHNLEEAYRMCGELVVLVRGSVAASGPKEEIFRRPPTLEVARLTGCKNFSRARQTGDACVEAFDWRGDPARARPESRAEPGGPCLLRVNQRLKSPPGHIAIRAHHVRVHGPEINAPGPRENQFPCWLAAINETPFRATLYLKIGAPAITPDDFHLQAEVFKQEWESFRDLPQPWQVELNADRLFLLPD